VSILDKPGELPLRRMHPASFKISEVDLSSAWAPTSASDKMDAARSSAPSYCVVGVDRCGSGESLGISMTCIMLVDWTTNDSRGCQLSWRWMLLCLVV